MISSVSAFANASAYTQNARRTQGSNFDISKPITVYMLDEQCIYSSTAADGQSVHVIYEEGSTPEDPVVRIFGNSLSGEYEEIVHINEIDPSNATYAELCALLAHKNRTGEYTSGQKTLLEPVPFGVDRGDYSARGNFVQKVREYGSGNQQNGSYWMASTGESLLNFYDQYMEELSKNAKNTQKAALASLTIDYMGRFRVKTT